jgi:hypothetical protein
VSCNNDCCQTKPAVRGITQDGTEVSFSASARPEPEGKYGWSTPRPDPEPAREDRVIGHSIPMPQDVAQHMAAFKVQEAKNTLDEAAKLGEQFGYVVKDSGRRQEFGSGMVRDTTEGKTMWSLVLDGPMLGRYARHLTLGAIKYAARNWMKASGNEEMERFRESAIRHFVQWCYGAQDEDHAAAVWFNINGYEYVKGKMKQGAE